MDEDSKIKLVSLLRTQRTASLGTLRDEAPLVSMTLFLAAADYAGLYILASTLAQHTQDFLADSRVSLMIAEADLGLQDPQTLARVSIRGIIERLAPGDPEFEPVKARYLEKYPDSAQLFNLSDFSLYRITPRQARYVAGFAKAFNLTPGSLTQLASVE